MNCQAMLYWTKKLYQCVFFIYFLSNYSFVDGSNETTVASNETSSIDGRIVNGSKVPLGKFPYIVSLRRHSSMTFFCGGSMIKERWVLTAAHCMFERQILLPESAITVVGGDLKLHPAGFGRQTGHVKKRIMHPTFDNPTLRDDIALLMLEEPFVINRYLQLINWSSSIPLPGTKCVAAGWGYMKESVPVVSNDLLSVQVPLLSRTVCKNLLSGIIRLSPNMLCAGYMEGGKDACQGDSGGPFECDGLLTGIISGGLGCARARLPGFYTNVKPYTKWIYRVIESNGLSKVDINSSNILLVASLYTISSFFFV